MVGAVRISLHKLAAVFLAVLVIGAQGQASSPVDASEGIAGAKRELEAAKAAAAPGAATSARSLPVLELPALNGPSTEMPLRPPVEAARRTEARSRATDWVVPEAPERNRVRGGSIGVSEEMRSGRDQGSFRLEPATQSGPREVETAVQGPPRDGAALRSVNPLAPFLSGWISAQDYRLLTQSRDTDQSVPPVSFTSGAGRASAPSEPIADGFPVEPRRGANPAPRTAYDGVERGANPYLESFVSAPAPSKVGGPLPTSGQSTATAGLPSSPPMIPNASSDPIPAPSRVPDFVRSTADAKYFKPLKRF